MYGIAQITDYFDYTTGLVRDGDTKEGLPQASIQVVDENGNQLDTGVAADNEGKFRIYSPKLQSNFLLISYVGYDVILVDLSTDPYYAVYELYSVAQEREPVEVVAKRRRDYSLAIGSGLVLVGSVLHYASRGSFGQVTESKKSFYDKYYADQPRWAKGLIGVTVVGGVAFIGWKIYRAAQRRKQIERAAALARQAASDLEKLIKDGVKPSWSKTQYEAWSQMLAQAMGGCGSDEDAILAVFGNMKNDADVLSLIATFGVRAYEPCFYTNPIDHALWVFNQEAFASSLDAWFARDLSTGNIDDINKVLSGKGIKYRF